MNNLGNNLDTQIMQLQANFKYFESQQKLAEELVTEQTHICTDNDVVEKKKETISAKFEEISKQIAQQIQTNSSLESTRKDLENDINDLSTEWNGFSKTITKLSIGDAQSQFCPGIRKIAKQISEIRRKNAAFNAEIRKQQTIQTTNSDIVPEILKDKKTIDLLKQSLSFETKHTKELLPNTFFYAEKLVQKILNGEYGDTIRELLVTSDNSLFSPDGFLRLLIIDMCRNNHNLFELETIRDILENKKQYCQTIATLENLMTAQEVNALATALAKTSNKTIESVYSDISESASLPEQQLFNKVLGQLVQESVTDTDRKEKTVPYACISRNTFSRILESITTYFRPQTPVLMQALIGGLVKGFENLDGLRELITDEEDKNDLNLLFALYSSVKPKQQVSKTFDGSFDIDINSVPTIDDVFQEFGDFDKKANDNFDIAKVIKTFEDLDKIEKFIVMLVSADLIQEVIGFVHKLPETTLQLPDARGSYGVNLKETIIETAIRTLTQNDVEKAIFHVSNTLDPKHHDFGFTIVAETLQVANPDAAIENALKIKDENAKFYCEQGIVEAFFTQKITSQYSLEQILEDANRLLNKISPSNKDACLRVICIQLFKINNYATAIRLSDLATSSEIKDDIYTTTIYQMSKKDPKKAIELVKATTTSDLLQKNVYSDIFSAIGEIDDPDWEGLLSEIPREYKNASFASFVNSIACKNVAKAIELVQQNSSLINEEEKQKFVDRVFSTLFSQGMITQAFSFYETITPRGSLQKLDFDPITTKIPAFIGKVSLIDIIETIKRLPDIGKLLCNAMTPSMISKCIREQQLMLTDALHLASYFDDPVIFFNVVFSIYLDRTSSKEIMPLEEIMRCILKIQPQSLRLACVKSFCAIAKWYKKDDILSKVGEILKSAGFDTTSIREYISSNKIKWDGLTHQALVFLEVSKTKVGVVQTLLDTIQEGPEKLLAESKVDKLETLLKAMQITDQGSMSEVDAEIDDVPSEEGMDE